MSTEENKAIVRRWNETLNTGDLSILDELGGPNYILHGEENKYNLKESKQMLTSIRTTFPDINLTIEDQIAEGDKVVIRYTIRGTHSSGKELQWTGISIYRLENGKIAEDWAENDMMNMWMQELGGISPTG